MSAYLQTEYHVDVRDCARLHVVAILDPEVVDERIFAYADKYSYNDIMGILRKLSPSHKFPEDKPDLKPDQSRILRKGRAEELLRKHYGQGFIHLEESIKANVAHVLWLLDVNHHVE